MDGPRAADEGRGVLQVRRVQLRHHPLGDAHLGAALQGLRRAAGAAPCCCGRGI